MLRMRCAPITAYVFVVHLSICKQHKKSLPDLAGLPRSTAVPSIGGWPLPGISPEIFRVLKILLGA
jgi:hypothetical protein